ncbi:hypothetical protein TCAL_16765 [Tigriopus californicus]|uniref:Uncharacterized protein n=1 Tax=Tigriopus californicus TaxID=6832 RepID=A0A553PSK2_TIGCA|nr:hypothetical protein TCAL_16765 [Tigriopus californicus]
MSNQASQPSTPEQYLALPPVTVDTAASESRLVANGNANANVQASDIPSYGGDYYEYYYDTPAVGVVQEAEQPNQGLTAPALDPEPTGYALGTTGVASQDNQLQDSTKVAQRMKLAQMRRRLRQKLMKQQQEQKQLQEQQQQQQQQQQQLEQKQQLANSASGFQDEYASELGSGVSGMGLGGLGGLDDSIMDYYDTSLNLGMGDANLSPNIGQRRGVTKKGKKMRRLGGVRYGGLNALGNDLTELGGSGVGTGASLGSGLGSGNGLANYGLGAPSAQLSPTLGMAAGGAVGFGLNSRGGHGHRGGHGGHGGYGHGGHGVIVLKKKKNTDDDNGLFSYLEDLFGELDIDYETFALLLGVAGAIASFVLFTVISSAGRRRSLPGGSVGVSWLNILSDFVYHVAEQMMVGIPLRHLVDATYRFRNGE